MKEEEALEIMSKLEGSRPIIKETLGINNKRTFYNANCLWEILLKHEGVIKDET